MERKNVYAGEICTLYFNDRMGGTRGMRLLKGKKDVLMSGSGMMTGSGKRTVCPFSRE